MTTVECRVCGQTMLVALHAHAAHGFSHWPKHCQEPMRVWPPGNHAGLTKEQTKALKRAGGI